MHLSHSSLSDPRAIGAAILIAASLVIAVASLPVLPSTRSGATSTTGAATTTSRATSRSCDVVSGTCTTTTTTTTTSPTTQTTVVTTTTTTTTENSTSSQTTNMTTVTTTTTTNSTTSTTNSTTSVTTSTVSGASLTVYSDAVNGSSMSGFYAELLLNGATVESGFTPISFNLTSGLTYQVEVQSGGSYHFQYWQENGWVNSPLTVNGTTATVTAVMCNGPCSDASTAPSPADGVTVYASRIPAPYWANCFAVTCSAGAGPGASMYVVLENSTGAVLQSGFTDEWGLTFTGLTPGATYYVYAEDCSLCHGSNHSVTFNYWFGGTVGTLNDTTNPLPVMPGAVVEAWYSCTNSCS